MKLEEAAADSECADNASASASATAAIPPKHPLDTASFLSRLFFGWMMPYIWMGWRHGLRRTDMPAFASQDEQCQRIGKKLLANWIKELDSCNWRQNHESNGRPATTTTTTTTATCENGDSVSSPLSAQRKQKQHISSSSSVEGDSGGGGSAGRGKDDKERSFASSSSSSQRQQQPTPPPPPREPRRRPSLTRVVVQTHARWILINSLITFFAEVVCKSLGAYSVGQMLLYMTNRELMDHSSGASVPVLTSPDPANLEHLVVQDPLVFWTMSLVLVSFCWALSAHFYGFQMMRVGLHVRVGCSYLMYRKSLKLQESSQTTMGKMTNLLTNDLDKFNYVCIMIPFLWVGPLQTIVSIALLWPILGPSCLGSLLILALLTPIQFYLSGKFASYRSHIAGHTDDRVRTLNETMTSLKMLKLYGWEIPFREKLSETRKRETDLVYRVGIIKGFNAALMYTSSKLVLFVTIIFHCLIFGEKLDAKTLFMSMAMLNNVQNTMTQLLPRLVSLGGESLISLQRIRDFLLLEEFKPSSRLWLEPILPEDLSQLGSPGGPNKHDGKQHKDFWDMFDTNKLTPLSGPVKPNKQIDAFIKCQNIGARWSQANIKTLSSVSFKCEAPELIMICGQVGSGKTSLFMSLLNELPISDGTARVCGSISFSSQIAWIFAGTVRDNIIFGGVFNESRYRRIVEVCALRHDFNLLENGDLTHINEEYLSGGQRARINLARALYRECDIYLLDDPFSAIDGPVAGHIFEKAIVDFLRDKLVLFASHKIQFLKRCDRILLLDQGSQLAYCDFHELQSKFRAPIGQHFTRKQLARLAFLADAIETLELVDESDPKTSLDVGKRDIHTSLCETKSASQKPTSFSAGNNISTHELPKCSLTNISLHPRASTSFVESPGRKEVAAGNTGTIDECTSESPSSHYRRKHDSNQADRSQHCASKSARDLKQVEAEFINSSGKPAVVSPNMTEGNDLKNKFSTSIKTTLTVPLSSNNRYQIDATKRVTRNQDGLQDEENASEESKLAGLNVWFKYYTQSSTTRLIILISSFLLTQTLFSTVDIYLTVWSMIEQNKALLTEISQTNQLIFDNMKNQPMIKTVKHPDIDLGDQSFITMIDSNCSQASMRELFEYGSKLHSAHLNQSTNKRSLHFRYDCIQNTDEDVKDSGMQTVRISPIASQNPSVAMTDYTSQSILRLPNFVSRDDITYSEDLTMPTQEHSEDNPLHKADNLASHDQLQNSLLSDQHKPKNLNNSTSIDDPINETNTGSSNARPDEPEQSIDTLTFDQDLLDESESAFNVRAFYRPLYVIVNNLTSQSHATIYACLLLALFTSSAITNVLSYSTSNRSAKILYEKLTDSALFAKLSFFDHNPIGRFINRATRDMGIIDEAIPYNANQSYDALLQTAATFIIVSAIDFKLAPLSLMILFIVVIYHSIHICSTKDIQRAEGIARSPIISHISTTLVGLHTVRVTKSESRFEQLFMRHQDAHTSVFILKLGCNRCMAVILDLLNATYIGLIAMTAIVSGMSGPSAGLIITSAMLLSGLTQHGVMKLTETESLMTSVERVIEYCNLPQEECPSRRRCRRPNNAITGGLKAIWPSQGCLEFRNVDLYYNRSSNKPVLRNISFAVRSGERIGIIGRTGAGKSSILTTLFRLYDYDGTILLDDVDIRTLNLIELRSSIGIIPQSPVLFSASVRHNLDPMNTFDDFTLWTALDKANLREVICSLPGQLEYNIGHGGLSTGQKQLICLARVLLRQNKLIVMDEATANVDPTTDAILQTTIRSEFKQCTVITIAHRLETILDCDRIMALDAGRIVEFDTPERLATKEGGYFAKLIRKTVLESE